MAIIDLANPTSFINFVNSLLPWLSSATVLVFAFGWRCKTRIRSIAVR